MSEQRPSASFFTHRLTILKPEGFGEETEAAIDRFVLAQFGQRWAGAFARLRRGDYLLRLDDETTSDAYNLTMVLAMALFGRISTRAVVFEPLEAAARAETSIELTPSEVERLTAALARHAMVELGVESAGAASRAAPSAEENARSEENRREHRHLREALAGIDAASRTTRAELAAMRDELARALERFETREAAIQPAPELDTSGFAEAKSGAIAFAASMKSVARRVEASGDALGAVVDRLGAAATAAEKTAAMRGEATAELRATLAALTDGQARLMARVGETAADEQWRAEDAAVAATVSDPREGRFEAMIFALAGEIDANRAAAAALGDAVDTLATKAGEVAAEVASARLEDMRALAESNRDAAEQMLDIAFAWQTGLDGAAEEAATIEAEADADQRAAG